MTQRENVIKGLECCISGNPAICKRVGCPYAEEHEGIGDTCIDHLMADALALLKAQETVVLAGAELTDAELIEKIRKAPIVMKPNVDAVPVVHARWKDNGNETVSCSRCATWFPKEREPYMLYCGCCGARMDGERRDS